jgi:hypothetical protein
MPEYARFKMGPTEPAPPTIHRVIALDGQTPRQIMRILCARIEELDRRTDSKYAMDYASAPSYDRAEVPIRPLHRWAAVYAVTGGSEGHYVHVELIYQHDEHGHWLPANEHRPIGIVKVFGGWEAAAELAGIIGKWLDA